MPSGINFEQYVKDSAAQRKNYMKGFVESQEHLNYPAYLNTVVRNKGSEVGEIEQEWQIAVEDAGESSIQGYNPFGTITNRRVDTMVQLTVKPTTFVSHTNCIRDIYADKTFNAPGSGGFRYKLKDADESAAIKAYVKAIDKAVLNAPTDPTAKTGLSSLYGALGWAGLSQTSGGTFVSQSTMAKNGIYATLGDGTVVATVAGADRSVLRNKPLRTPVATRGSVRLAAEDLEQISLGLVLINYRYMQGLRGTVPNSSSTTPNFGVYMSLEDEQNYRNLINQLGGDRNNDYYVIGQGMSVDRRVVYGSQNMPRTSIRPIIGINHNQFKLWTVNGSWGEDRPNMLNENVVTNNRYYTGQIRCETPGESVFCIHGSW